MMPRTSFSRHLLLNLLIYTAMVLGFVVYVHAEKEIDEVNDVRFHTLQLMVELRQSSDDLTRMARSFVVTGDARFRAAYDALLAQREGRAGAAVLGSVTDWDQWLDDPHAPSGAAPSPSQSAAPSVALLTRMATAGFTPAELAQLREAKHESDALTALERQAMAMITQGKETPPAVRLKAIELLQSPAYFAAKARIMTPIARVTAAVAQRTTAAVERAETIALVVRLGFILLIGLLLFVWWRTWLLLNRILGEPLDELREEMARIGAGDFSGQPPASGYPLGSVAEALARTRSQLFALSETQAAHEAKIERMQRLYAALSQCNQAIVRCQHEQELLEQVCTDAITYAGMRLAWIGRVEPESGRVRVVAQAGDHQDYLENIEISINPELPTGQGVVGNAIRLGQAVWIDDFAQDARMAAWHERGARSGWRSVASLPLIRQGAVWGAFSLYSDELAAFDEAAQNLLLEMALDISFALDNFDHRAERERLFQAQQQLLERMKRITSHVPGMLFEVRLRPDGRMQFPFASSGVYQIYHLKPEDILEDATPLFQKIHPDDRAMVVASIERSAKTLQPWRMEYRLLDEDGQIHWLYGYSLPERETDGSTLWTGIKTDISERKQTEERFAALINFDPLTGLPSRKLLLEHFEYTRYLSTQHRQPYAVIFLDLDHFKNINETLGHDQGDELLIRVAERMKKVLRPQDTLSRQGGDEFTLLLPDCDSELATRIAQRMIETIRAPFVLAGREVSLGVSMGIAVAPADGDDFITLSKHADIALYRAKQNGRNGFRFFTQEMQTQSNRLMTIDSALRRALAEQQFSLVYQPQVSLHTGQIVGAEVLLRWQHPELGAISPAEFIPIAEDNGLILPIGDWVLTMATRDAGAWVAQATAPFVLAVNLSAIQFRQRDLPARVAEILQAADFPAQHLELELTERSAMENPETAVAQMAELDALGIRLSMDDFGTGYSSLSYLKRFKLYKLKIDQSFVRDMTEDADDRAIVSTIIHMAQSLGLSTIAEGVETAEQLALLQAMGCEESQGYFTGRPMSAADLTALLAKQFG
ncbi:EAL domain-containing protein [Halothiobacillus sp. DCM-1]|uniref:EAL domain-containing protein n=1 Tax=Halothiobacillus sp. DCM-1 TaxID=3112558 RepID=UPI0032535FEC